VAARCEVHVVHVDHGLRPGTEAEAEVVAAASAELGATCEVVRARVAPGADLEARARAARYEVLPPGTLVGHTADDQAETILLNLLRGSGLEGLAAMRREGGGPRLVRRPLLALRRRETAALVCSLGWSAVADMSNDDLRFRRNRVRHELVPMLAEISGRDPVPVLARTAALLGEDAAFLAELASALDPTDVRALRAAPKPVATRALRRWIAEGEGPEHHPPSAAELGRAWCVVDGVARACQLSGGRRLARRAGRLRVEDVEGNLATS
jgi:tRNA(Ile)-lysidine synthase